MLADLVGCSRSGSEVVEPPPSVVTATVWVADEVHVVPSNGWDATSLESRQGVVHYVVSADGEKDFQPHHFEPITRMWRC